MAALGTRMASRSKILSSLRDTVEPLNKSGSSYAASAVLTDGTVLHRVIFHSGSSYVDYAVNRLTGSTNNSEKFRSSVEDLLFENRIESKFIQRVEWSKYACPVRMLDITRDPVEMLEYANFALKMDDGKLLYFDIDDVDDFMGPPDFLDLPEPYGFENVTDVYDCKSPPNSEEIIYYGTEPIFYCFIGEPSA